MMNSQTEKRKTYTTLKTKNAHGIVVSMEVLEKELGTILMEGMENELGTTLTEGTVNEHGTISMEAMENAAQNLWKKVNHHRNKVENLCQKTHHTNVVVCLCFQVQNKNLQN